MRQKTMKTANPWMTIVEGENIAECDKDKFPKNKSAQQYADEINSKNIDVKLTFDCLPDPYNGNPESKVYCLCKNPGKPDSCFVGEQAFVDATIANLQLKSKSCFWAEDIMNKSGKPHEGVNWLAKRTKELKEILDGHPDIFFIEFFPYHSSKGFYFPSHLPSYDFTDELIEQAMRENKIIIIMRERRRWLKRIKGLADYPNLYILKSPQSGYLTRNNIVRLGGNGITEDEIKKSFKL